MSIVVGVDGSEHAREALRWAVEEGRAHGWPVRGVLAWNYLDQHGDHGEAKFRPDYSDADAAAALDAIVDSTVPGAPVERVAVNDLPAAALLGAATDADLLVVGVRGLGTVKGMALGSVSQQCVHHSPIPVAVVRTHDGPPPAGGVVVGIDGSDNSLAALRFALAEGRAHSVPVTVLHATRMDPDPAVIDQALADCDPTGVEVRRAIVEDTPATAILGAAADASLVVVGSRGRGGFAQLLLGSVSRRVVATASVPVVVVPPVDRRPA